MHTPAWRGANEWGVHPHYWVNEAVLPGLSRSRVPMEIPQRPVLPTARTGQPHPRIQASSTLTGHNDVYCHRYVACDGWHRSPAVRSQRPWCVDRRNRKWLTRTTALSIQARKLFNHSRVYQTWQSASPSLDKMEMIMMLWLCLVGIKYQLWTRPHQYSKRATPALGGASIPLRSLFSRTRHRS